jgi:HPt (histidine-containing phosphotransfer) domain-containing protein
MHGNDKGTHHTGLKSRMVSPLSAQEVEKKCVRRFLDRLELRIKKIRILVLQRDWAHLRTEVLSLGPAAGQFGFETLSKRCQQLAESIPQGRVSRVAILLLAKQAAHLLLQEMDQILIDQKSQAP